MGLITGATLAGAGRGLNEVGAAMGRYAQEIELLEQRRQARLAEIAAERQAKRDEEQGRLTDARRMFGVDGPEKTQADFTKTRKVGGTGDGGELVDEVTPDTEGFTKYKRERGQNEARAAAFARNPASLDSIERSLRDRNLRDELAEANGDPAKLQAIAKREAAGSGKYEDPEDARLKRALTQSQIDENNAQRDRARRDPQQRTNSPAYKALERQYSSAEASLRQLESRLSAAEDAAAKAILPQEQQGHQARIARLNEQISEARAKRDELGTRMDNFTEDSPGARPKGDGEKKAPYADGTRLRGADGKTYVVKGGKPVLEK